MSIKTLDELKYLISGYFGIREMDEYDLKVYVLEQIRDYINHFIENNPMKNVDYRELAQDIQDHISVKTKLQDSLLVLNKIDAPIELILMIKKRIKQMHENNSIYDII